MIFVQEAKPPSRRKVLATLEAILDLMPEKPAYVKGILERADISGYEAQISELLQSHQGMSVDDRFVPPMFPEFQIEWPAEKLSREKLLALAKASMRSDNKVVLSTDSPKVKLDEICWRLFYRDGAANIVFNPDSMRVDISYKGKEPARMYKLIDVIRGSHVGYASVEGKDTDTLGKLFAQEKFLSGIEKLFKMHGEFSVAAMPAVSLNYGSVAKQLAFIDKDAKLAKQGSGKSVISLLATPEDVMNLARSTLSYYLAAGNAPQAPSLLLDSVSWQFGKTFSTGTRISVDLFDDEGRLFGGPCVKLDGRIAKEYILQVRKAFAGSGVNLYVRGN